MSQIARGFSLRHKLHAVCKTNISHLCCLIILLYQVPLARAQDSPGRFELGDSFTALRFSSAANFGLGLGGNVNLANFGPGLEGDFNLGRHFGLDGAFNWLPAGSRNHAIQGLFGGKVGTRTEHFGFFGKVRPGFVSRANQLREEMINLLPSSYVSPVSPSSRLILEVFLSITPQSIGRCAMTSVIRWFSRKESSSNSAALPAALRTTSNSAPVCTTGSDLSNLRLAH